MMDGKTILIMRWPILLQYNVPATFFLSTDAINTGELFWPQDIATKSKGVLHNNGHEKVNRALYECWPEQTKWCNSNKQTNMPIIEQWIEFLKTLDEKKRKERIKKFYYILSVNDSPLQGYILNWEDLEFMKKTWF